MKGLRSGSDRDRLVNWIALAGQRGREVVTPDGSESGSGVATRRSPPPSLTTDPLRRRSELIGHVREKEKAPTRPLSAFAVNWVVGQVRWERVISPTWTRTKNLAVNSGKKGVT
jgi:hypothetical protein